jgi:hypothetical protein
MKKFINSRRRKIDNAVVTAGIKRFVEIEFNGNPSVLRDMLSKAGVS